MKALIRVVLTALLTVGVVNTAAAYVGPGAGLSLIGAVWGLLSAIFAAVAFVVLWPVRRLMKRSRAQGKEGSVDSHQRSAEASNKAPSDSRTAS